MWRNYLLTTIRNLWRKKLFALINIVGLSVGIAASLLILIWIRNELSVDAFHKKGNRAYRVVEIQNAKGRNPTHVPYTPVPLAPALKMDFPAVEDAVRVSQLGEVVVSRDNLHITAERGFAVEDGFFDIMTFSLKGADGRKVLKQPFQAILSRDLATRLFGAENPIGRRIDIQGRDLTVAAVMQPDGHRNHLEPDLLISYPTLKAGRFVPEGSVPQWANNSLFTYVLLKPGSNVRTLEEQLPAFLKRHAGEDYHTVMYLQNIRDIYLHSQKIGYSGPWLKGNLGYIAMFGAVALFLLLIACFNFMNLATAQATGRALEVGVRKVIGAKRSQLMGQFFIEAMLLTGLSFLIALALTEVTLPYFNQISGQSLRFSTLLETRFVIGLPVLLLIVGLAAGSYPAIYLSRYQPARVLRGGGSKGPRSINRLRRVLVIMQFGVTVFLISATGIVFYQLHYVQSVDLGYQKDGVVVVQLERDLREASSRLKERLTGTPGIASITVSSTVPGKGASGEYGTIPSGYEGNESWTIPLIRVDGDYLKTFQIKLLEGRSFVVDGSGASDSQVMITESTARQFGWKNPLGKTLKIPGWSDKQLEVVGLVKDYHIKSLHDQIEPIILVPQKNAVFVSFRLSGTENPGPILARIKDAWNQVAPGRSFRSYFLDSVTGALYRNDERAGEIMGYGAGLAILVACLGLFGLVVFETRQRTKEIGIRKVLGASAMWIVSWLSLRFVRWLLVANVVAIPICWWVMTRWLAGFAYRVGNVLPVYIMALLGSLIIGFVTVGFQAFKAASSNPVDALKYE
jgi:putative ABC transport system permease protein